MPFGYRVKVKAKRKKMKAIVRPKETSGQRNEISWSIMSTAERASNSKVLRE